MTLLHFGPRCSPLGWEENVCALGGWGAGGIVWWGQTTVMPHSWGSREQIIHLHRGGHCLW